VAGVQLLSLAIGPTGTLGDEAGDQTTDAFSAPVRHGLTTIDPVVNLTPPRNNTEDIYVSPSRTRALYGFGDYNSIYNPLINTKRCVRNHPGELSIPMLSLSNRTMKRGVLIYAVDATGVHAKVFNWWSDGRKVQIRIYDQCDSEFDAYGLGGKWQGTDNAPDDNTIGWTVRIRPYVSPTKWSDHYAAVLYRREAIDDQEYVPKPFWERARDGDIDQRVADAPFSVVGFGMGPSDAGYALSGAAAWQDVYTGEVDNEYRPALWVHMHTNSFDVSGANHFSYGAETGAIPKAPDYLPVQSDFATYFPLQLETGLLPSMSYQLFSFHIHSGSTWNAEWSALDAGRKSAVQANRTLTSGAYASGEFFNDVGPIICLEPDLYRNKGLEHATGLAAAGTNAYHDTFGAWNIGCYANEHTWTSGSSLITGTPHPRNTYCHYFNRKATDLLGEFGTGQTQQMHANWTGVGDVSFINSSEVMGDTSLRYAACSIEAEPARNRKYFSTTDSTYGYIVRGASPFGVAPPVWEESVPLFNTVHGNRSRQYYIFGHLGHTVTATGAYFLEGYATGVAGGVSLQPTMTGLEQHQAGQSFAASSVIGLGTTLSISNWDPSLSGVATFEALDPTPDDFISGALYTGIMNFSKGLMRTVAGAKEYHLYGNMTYPLDSWESEIGYVAQAEGTNPKHTSKYHGQKSGEFYVMHNMREHRDGAGKLLLTAVNWSTGSKNFTGVFTPASHEFEGSYNVYDVSNETATLGARTLLTKKLPGASYTIEGTMSPGASQMWEFEDLPAGSLSKCDFRSERVPVRYSYGKKSIRSASVTVGYSYGADCYTFIDPPMVGFKAAATQSMLNNLPQWMDMRQREGSRGWKMVNAWGMAQENLSNLSSRRLRNLFLSTTDRFLRHRLYRGDVTENELFEFAPSRNLLFNSTLSMEGPARTRLPEGWTDYHKPTVQTITLVDFVSLVGSRSVKVAGAGTLGQLVDISGLGTADKMAASVYIKSDSAVDISLVLTIQGTSTDTISREERYTGTPTGWHRLSLTVPANREVFEAQFVVRVNSSSVVYLDAPQLEVGSKASDWQGSDLDNLPYVGSTLPFRLVEAKSSSERVTLFAVGDTEDFADILIPTRISREVPPPKDLEPFSSSTLGKRVDFFNTATSVEWGITLGQVAERDANNVYEVFAKYDIRDLRFFQGQGYGTVADCDATISPITTAVRDDLLFVVCREGFRNRTIRTLKVLTPRRPPAGQTYLESLTDFELDLPFSTTYGAGSIGEEVATIGFSEKDPSWMVLNTNIGRRFYFKMRYDYYFVNPDNRTLYTLENYESAQIKLT
jgi:hypothetical protein